MRRVYLDSAATTRVAPEVVEEMLPYLKERFGNPSSLYDEGQEALEAITEARGRVARLIGAVDEEIVFTSSGSESNNLAIKGIAWARHKKGKHLVVSAIEHFSVLHAARTLEKQGFEVTQVPVDSNGLVDPADVGRAIRDDTILVSVMHANGEVGTIEPLAEISAITRERGIPLHTDAVASAGTVPVNVNELGVDALSLAGSMFYGPKGAGALYLRHGTRVVPLLDGGIQEDGRRAGTENVPGIVGLGKAAETAATGLEERAERLAGLQHRLETGLLESVEHVHVNARGAPRLPDRTSISVEFVEGESMLMFLNMEGIAAASGSSCTSRALKASHVLIATGLGHELAQGTLLFSTGRDTTEDDVDYLLDKLPPIVQRLRDMSPLYTKFRKETG
ncbi:MAG: aminotransferase class V-fold PLP-dependent enzyme [Actinobacteria bacterium]|nr:MAG: aminotransferase class V-fold PLP-dependent enzyme [Actinomycetota bacterium]